MTRSEHGFTLLEILVVVMIIGMLAVVLATQLLSRAGEAKAQAASIQVQKIENLLEVYRLDNGRYPTAEQGLRALVTEPQLDPVPRRYPPDGYARSQDLDDPWGAPYQYELPGSHNPRSYDVYSWGPDGQPDTEDDIGNWDREA